MSPQILSAVTSIGLEVRGLRPFIPRIDEDEPLAGRMVAHGSRDRLAQPMLVDLRRRVNERERVVLPARRIVPTGHHRAVPAARRRGPSQRVEHVLPVVDDGPAKRRIDERDALIDRGCAHAVRRKFNERVEAVYRGIDCVVTLHRADVDFADAFPRADLAPRRDGRRGVGEHADPVDDEKRLAVDTDVACVAEMREDIADQPRVAIRRWIVCDQDFVIGTVPAPRPVLVGPAETVRKVGLAVCPHLLDGPLEQALAVEPVVVDSRSRGSRIRARAPPAAS